MFLSLQIRIVSVTACFVIPCSFTCLIVIDKNFMDKYVLEVLYQKLVRARCVEAVSAMEKLAKAEKKGLRISGRSDSRVARETYEFLLGVK